MAFRFVDGKSAFSQSRHRFRLGNAHHVGHFHAFASRAHRQNHVGAFFYHFPGGDAAIHNDSLFVFRAFLIFDFGRKPQLQKGHLDLVLAFSDYFRHLNLFFGRFILRGFLFLLAENTRVKNPESSSHQEKHDASDENGRHHRQNRGYALHFRVVIFLLVFVLLLIIVLIFDFVGVFLLVLFFLRHIPFLFYILIRALFHIGFPAQVHGFLKPVPVDRLSLYFLPLAAAYHFRGTVLVGVHHLHKVLVGRHKGTL